MRGRRFRACDGRGPRGVRRPGEGDRTGLQTRGPGAFLDDARRVGGDGPRAPRSLPEEVSLPRELGGEVPRPGRSAIRPRLPRLRGPLDRTEPPHPVPPWGAGGLPSTGRRGPESPKASVARMRYAVPDCRIRAMRSPRSGWLARPIPGKSIVRTSISLRPAAYPATDCRYSNESRSTTRWGCIDSRYAARISGRPRSCHHRFILPNGGVGSAIDRAYAGTVSRDATRPRRPEAMTTSTFGARFDHASSGMLMYMLPWKRRYAGRSPPGRTDPCGLLWRTSSSNPPSCP